MDRVAAGEFLSSLGGLRQISFINNGLRKPILVLAYHRIFKSVQEDLHPFDVGLLSASVEDFDWQMSVLRREFHPIPLSDIGLYMRGRKKLPKRPVIVTFDDGYSDNYHNAFPVLKKYSIPATLFITTAHIGTDIPLWHDLAPNVVIRAKHGVIPSIVGDIILEPGDTLEKRREAGRRLLGFLKYQPHAVTQALVARLCEEHKQALRPEDNALVALLTWDQVREMAAEGIEIGSHTMTHAMLSRLTPLELREELRGSKAMIEQEIQRPCETIAYPVGRSYSYDETSLAEVGLAGYRIGVAYDDGVNWAGAVNLFALRRKSIERDTSRAYFKAMVALPEWFR